MVADGARKQNHVAGPRGTRRALDSGNGPADTSGGDVHAVRLAVLDNFGIAARYDDSGGTRRPAHGANFCFQDFGGQAGFEHVRDDQRFSPGARNSEVVNGSVDCQLADGAARKAQRAHHKAIGGDGEASAVQTNVRRVAERFHGWTEEDRREESFDQSAAGLPARAVRHFDLCVLKPDLW